MSQTQNPFAAKPAAVNPFAAETRAPLTPAADPDPSLAELLDRAAELRDRKAALVKEIDAERAEVNAAIFNLSGQATGKHTDTAGREYTFRKPSSRRSADYDLLQSMYPQAYAAAVKVTEPAEDATPTLVLGKGFKR